MDEIFLIEFNPETEQFHYEPLESRLQKNAAQLLYERKVRNSNWIPIALAMPHMAWRKAEVFLRRWQGAEFSEEGIRAFVEGKTTRLL
jgi:hypothetical protein